MCELLYLRGVGRYKLYVHFLKKQIRGFLRLKTAQNRAQMDFWTSEGGIFWFGALG